MAANPDTCDLLCLDLRKAEAARAELPGVEVLTPLAAAAKALGDPTRLAIAVALESAGDACVCDLAWIVGRDERLVSHHVRLLRGAGLARSRREGKMVIYELSESGRALVTAVIASGPAPNLAGGPAPSPTR